MQIIRFKFPRKPDIGENAIPPIHLVANYFSIKQNQELHLYDLHETATLLMSISNVRCYALSSSCLIVCDAEDLISRWEDQRGVWQCTRQFRLPGGFNGPIQRNGLSISVSGRYLAVECGEDRQHFQALLLDAFTGRIKYSTPFKISSRAHFAVLPSGEEVLFLSAPDYMGIQMIHCSSGQLLHEYQSDFCHTDYSLSPDGTRLLTFGCIWAWPYEMRLYDISSWTDSKHDDPPPLLFRQEEVFEGDMVLPAQFVPITDGTFSCVALVDLAELLPQGSQDEKELLESLYPTDYEIYQELCQLPRFEWAILLRCVDTKTGKVLSWSLQMIPKTDETHTFSMPYYRVLLANNYIQLFDGTSGKIENLADVEMSGRYAVAVTPDGQTVILSQYEDF